MKSNKKRFQLPEVKLGDFPPMPVKFKPPKSYMYNKLKGNNMKEDDERGKYDEKWKTLSGERKKDSELDVDEENINPLKEKVDGWTKIIEDNKDIFKPLVKSVIDGFKGYSDEVEEIEDGLRKHIVKIRIDSILQYEEAGFDRGDAIIMTLNDVHNIKEFGKNLSKASETYTKKG